MSSSGLGISLRGYLAPIQDDLWEKLCPGELREAHTGSGCCCVSMEGTQNKLWDIHVPHPETGSMEMGFAGTGE